MLKSANELFKAGQLPQAIQAYRSTADLLSKLSSLGEEARLILTTVFVNMSVAQNRE